MAIDLNPAMIFAFATLFGIIAYFGKREVSNISKRLDNLEKKVDDIITDRANRNEKVNDKFEDIKDKVTEKLSQIYQEMVKLTNKKL